MGKKLPTGMPTAENRQRHTIATGAVAASNARDASLHATTGRDAQGARTNPVWQAWLADQLIQKGYGSQLRGRQPEFPYLRVLAEATGIHAGSISAYVWQGRVPEWDKCIAIAQALELNPLSVLHMAGRISLDQMRVMLSVPSRRLVSDEEYEGRREQYEAWPESAERAWRLQRLDEDYQATLALRAQLALPEAEWNLLVDETNSPDGRDRLREEIAGSGAMRQAERPAAPVAYLPREFTGGADEIVVTPPTRKSRRAYRPGATGAPTQPEPHF